MFEFLAQFGSDSPYLTFFLLIGVAKGILYVLRMPFRSLNIWKSGWAPAHVDADGDLVLRDTL